MQGTLDGGLSWLVVLSSFMQQFIVMGTHNVFGLFYIELLNEFKKGKAVTAWVGSLAFGLTFIMGPITTSMCHRFGNRAVSLIGATLFCLGLVSASFSKDIGQLYLTYSIVVAIGGSFCYYTSIFILDEFFDKRLVTTNGMALSGAGAGTFALSPIVGYFLEKCGWRNTMRIVGGIASVLFVCGSLLHFVPVPVRTRERHPVEEKGQKKYLFYDSSLFKNKAYVVWIVVLSLVMFGFYIPYVHLVRHCQDLNIPKKTGAMLVGYLAISQTIGKIVFGRIADHPLVNRVCLFQCCLLVCSVVTTLLPIMTTMETVALYCWFFGFHDGCCVVLSAVLTGDIVGKDKMSSAFGMLYFFSCFPMMLGPPVAALMYDMSGTYIPAFFMSGGFVALSVCLLFLVPVLLPPVISEQWEMRSRREEIQIPSTSSCSEQDTRISSEENSDTSKSALLEPKVTKLKVTRPEVVLTSVSGTSIAQERRYYFSMEHLVSQRDSLICRVYSKNNLYDTVQPWTRNKETEV